MKMQTLMYVIRVAVNGDSKAIKEMSEALQFKEDKTVEDLVRDMGYVR